MSSNKKGKHSSDNKSCFPTIHSNTYRKGTLYEYAYKPGSGKKRSRNKCKYYESESKWCNILRISCVGPSNSICNHYETGKKTQTTANHHKNPTDKIFMIPIDSIVLNGEIKIPSLAQINDEKIFYLENNRFTSPVLIAPQTDKFILKGFAHVFFAAQRLELSEVPCEYYINEEMTYKLEKIRKIGTEVYIRELKEYGKIIDFSYSKVFISFRNGRTISYPIHTAIKKSLIRFV